MRDESLGNCVVILCDSLSKEWAIHDERYGIENAAKKREAE
jgi:hypothetical protein